MSPTGARAVVAVIWGSFSLLAYSLSDSIPDQPVPKTFHLDPKGFQGQFQLVVGALDAKPNVLQRERQVERVRRAENPAKVVAPFEALHTAVDPTNAYFPNESYKNKSETKIKEMLLQNPKATFFRGENLTGEAVDYDSSNTTYGDGCQNEWDGIQSMRISESCVRVFKNEYCKGISRALYPKPNSGNFINFLTPELDKVSSVGPCLPNEFQFSTVSLNGSRIAVSKDESNVRQVPDFVDFHGLDTFDSKSTPITSLNNTVLHYYMDQGRPKWISAAIYKMHVKTNTGSTSGMNLAISPELGGPTNEAYNTFSQTPKNFAEWKRITDEVVAYLKQSPAGYVLIYVTFVYENPSAPNPSGFYYRIWSDKIVYGFIEN